MPTASAVRAASPSATAATSARRIRPCSAARWGGASSPRCVHWTPEEAMMLLFRALSALLSYPTAEMRGALPEIAGVIASSPLVAPRDRGQLLELVDALGRGELLTSAARH